MQLHWNLKNLRKLKTYDRVAVIAQTRYGTIRETAAYLGVAAGELTVWSRGAVVRVALDDLVFVAPLRWVAKPKG